MVNIYRILFLVMCGLLIFSVGAFITIGLQNGDARRTGLQNISDCLAKKGVEIRFAPLSGDFCKKELAKNWGNVSLPEEKFYTMSPVSGWFFPTDDYRPIDCSARPYFLARRGGCLP